MEFAHFEHPGFDRGRHLVRAGVGIRTAVNETTETLIGITPQPFVHGLAHPIAPGNVGDAGSVIEHLEHGLLPLFHESQLVADLLG